MKKRHYLVFFLIVLAVDAGGFGLSRLQENRFDFTPNFEMTFEYFIEGAEGKEVEIFLDGDLKQYAEIGDVIGDVNERRYFTVHMKLPEKLEPGMHSVSVGVRELGSIKSGSTAVSTRIGVIMPIKIFVPYEGKYVKVDFITKNANIGDDLEFLFIVESLGDVNITSLYGKVMIYDFNNEFIEELVTDKVSLVPFEKKELNAVLDLDDYDIGDYFARGIVFYDGDEKEVNSTFKVGSYVVNILGFTDVLEKDKLNKFNIDIESGWNGVINNVYALVSIFGSEIKTVSMNLKAFENQTLSTYVDTSNISIGEYPINISLYYGGERSVEDGMVLIKEHEKSLYILIKSFIIPVMVLILILLLVIDIVFLRKRKRLYKRKR